MVVLNQASAQSFETFLQKAHQLDLAPIAYQLMQPQAGAYWTKPQTVKAIAEYLAFLYLCDRHPRLQLVPSLGIDRVWHCHILDTQKYAEDCQFLFGYMIHHFPYLGLRGIQDQHNQKQAYGLTKNLLTPYLSSCLIEKNSLPGDCEPIQAMHMRSRPRIAVKIEEVTEYFKEAQHLTYSLVSR